MTARPHLDAIHAEVVSDLSGGLDGYDQEEWRVVLHYLAPEVAAGSLGGGAARGEVLEVGGAEWRQAVGRAARDCYPDLAPARALHRFNMVLGRPHVRQAVDTFREAEAVAVGAHRAVMRREAMAMVARPLPTANGESVKESDIAKLQLAKVAAMRFLAELDGHFFAVRESAAERRSLRADASQAGGRGLREAEDEARVADALAAKLQAATP